MATIGPVELKIRLKGTEAFVEVRYEIAFDGYDQRSNQPYTEVCKLIGDDTGTGDLPAPDHTVGFLTPLLMTIAQAGDQPSLKREWKKTFRKTDLDEDRGPIPDPDEIRAVVTLTPVLPSAVTRESNLVTKQM